jgi:hypothetical protein
MRNQWRRITEYDTACQREGRMKLLVLRGARLAEIILDTYPAGFRLTDAAVLDMAALFDKLSPSGRNWSITNNCLAARAGVAHRGGGGGIGEDRAGLPRWGSGRFRCVDETNMRGNPAQLNGSLSGSWRPSNLLEVEAGRRDVTVEGDRPRCEPPRLPENIPEVRCSHQRLGNFPSEAVR